MYIAYVSVCPHNVYAINRMWISIHISYTHTKHTEHLYTSHMLATHNTQVGKRHVAHRFSQHICPFTMQSTRVHDTPVSVELRLLEPRCPFPLHIHSGRDPGFYCLLRKTGDSQKVAQVHLRTLLIWRQIIALLPWCVHSSDSQFLDKFLRLCLMQFDSFVPIGSSQ